MSLDHRTFTVTDPDLANNPDAVAWLQTVYQGFVTDALNDKQLAAHLRGAADDHAWFRGVYDSERPAYASQSPVATFATYDQTLNVGGGALVPVTAVTDVSVRPTHRRRGLLRQMMTDELERARDRGHALAALTVTEGTIYGRFGFGVTTHTHEIDVDTSHGFALRGRDAGFPGRVDEVDREVATRLGTELFARCHADQFGSIDRMTQYAAFHSGELDHATGEAALGRRNAVYTGAGGEVEGWVAYAAQGEKRGTLKVHELLALTNEAHVALWQFLGSIDLITNVVWRDAPTDHVLSWALADPRGYRVRARHDMLWTRVLDPVAVLGARGYGEASGHLTIGVRDALGHAEGTFAVEVDQGRAEAWRCDDAAQITCGVEELGPLVLGGADPLVLAAAGRLTGEPTALRRAHALFGALGRPWTSTHF